LNLIIIYDSAIGDTYIWKGKDVCGSGELVVDWLRAHHFAVMATDEKARRLVPADSIDLRTPSFGGELGRVFNLYCSRN